MFLIFPLAPKRKGKTCRDVTCDGETTSRCEDNAAGPKCVCKQGYKENPNDKLSCVGKTK